ncbi:hypothetical protein LAZ67_6000628 [Cordylochernes scorpioides]|uniref:Endoplasmic reticulum vesicle transporter C-terminal domain-containing protein n=1 Tax=Cordylochernes scorpioides TaxID=51811 RepID=A0ABY6KLX9_9ARAC|nr:hypothetical protein LAZ67_6000628 [Cordylochernes scorpioides]
MSAGSSERTGYRRHGVQGDYVTELERYARSVRNSKNTLDIPESHQGEVKESFQVLLLEIFKSSIITGLPQIVTARSLISRIFKIGVLVGCLVGFFYQTSIFIKLYWSYPTLVDVRVAKPAYVDVPSITICNRNG